MTTDTQKAEQGSDLTAELAEKRNLEAWDGNKLIDVLSEADKVEEISVIETLLTGHKEVEIAVKSDERIEMYNFLIDRANWYSFWEALEEVRS